MPTYTTPTRSQSQDMAQYSRLTRYDVGRTLLLESGVWSLVDNPSAARLAAATTAYRGGYTYDLTTDQYNAIPSQYGGGGA